MEVPGQGRKDFQRACSAASDKKLAKAEEHLRKALHEDAQYPAAWVLLGQVLKAQKKPDEARNACSQALRVDPNYLPADLCLADLCALKQRWEEMLRFASSTDWVMPKSESHGADFSFDRIGLIPSICRHQSSIQGLLAFLQPFNVLSYGAIHKGAPRTHAATCTPRALNFSELLRFASIPPKSAHFHLVVFGHYSAVT